MSKQLPERVESLQLLRALAATLVVFGHVLHEYERYGNATVGILGGLPWGMGVDIFFVISGFIMVLTFRREFGQSGAPVRFFLRRVARIVPAYWIFTTLMVLAVILVPGRIDSAELDVWHVVQSYLFIPHFAPNGDLQPILALGWTLNYEMFFYLVFAVALLFPFRFGFPLCCLAMAGVYLAGEFACPTSDALCKFFSNSVLGEFLVGMGIAAIFGARRPGALLATAVIVMTCAFGAVLYFGAGISNRFVVLGIPAICIFVAVLAVPWPANLAPVRAGLLLGDASYALYLSHPFVVEVIRVVADKLGLQGMLEGSVVWAVLVFTMAAAFCFSILFFHVIERRMNAAARRVLGVSSRARPDIGNLDRHAAP